MKKIALLIALVMIFAAFSVGCGGQSATSGGKKDLDDIKVGFIYVGPIGDGGYTYAHNAGREYLEKELGVETTYIESVPESAEAETAIENLVKEGYNIIFATSFGHGPYALKVAEKYPEVVFMHCSGSDRADNMGTYFGKMIQARYLAGIAAGKATETNKIGYVAAMPIPEVIRGINAFTLGAQSVNPDVKVHVVWTNTWYDPAKEKQAAESLLDAGVDVMAQHQDTPGPVMAAQERGAYSTGYNTSMAEQGGEGYLTSPVWNFGPYYKKVVEAVANGTWKSEDFWGGMEEDIIKLDDFGPSVSDDTKALINEKAEAMKSGEFNVFAGPLKDQDGNVKVEDGKAMTDEEIWNMMWFVEGVVGEIPKN